MSRVEIHEYDAEWPQSFAQIYAHVWPAVRHAAMRLEHVGSTSVPGLAAKPVIDACIVVASRRDTPHVVKALATIGYGHRGNLGVPDRDAFTSPAGLPTHHLYVSPRGSLSLKNQLGLRDYLRAHPDAMVEYGALKKTLATRFPEDIDRYISGKTDFIVDVLRRIGLTSDELEEISAINQLEALARPESP